MEQKAEVVEALRQAEHAVASHPPKEEPLKEVGAGADSRRIGNGEWHQGRRQSCQLGERQPLLPWIAQGTSCSQLNGRRKRNAPRWRGSVGSEKLARRRS